MDILIFKTNLTNSMLVDHVQELIQQIPGIHRWNVDLHDIDSILRIEATQLSARRVETVLKEAGYFCEELAD